jgi:hypothetical protein
MNRELFLDNVQYIHPLRPLLLEIYICTRYYSIMVTGGYTSSKRVGAPNGQLFYHINRHFAEDRNRIRAPQIVTSLSASLAFLLRWRLLKGRNCPLRYVQNDSGQREISLFVFNLFLTCHFCVNV